LSSVSLLWQWVSFKISVNIYRLDDLKIAHYSYFYGAAVHFQAIRWMNTE